mgnify:CR=1 FL=1
MNFQSREDIKRLENKIRNGYSLPIFKGLVAVNKRGVEQIIDAIYANLPDDVKRAREFLKNSNQMPTVQPEKNHLFDTLQKLEVILNETISVANFAILKIKEIETLLQQIEKNIPEEIIQAEISDK